MRYFVARNSLQGFKNTVGINFRGGLDDSHFKYELLWHKCKHTRTSYNTKCGDVVRDATVPLLKIGPRMAFLG